MEINHNAIEVKENPSFLFKVCALKWTNEYIYILFDKRCHGHDHTGKSFQTSREFDCIAAWNKHCRWWQAQDVQIYRCIWSVLIYSHYFTITIHFQVTPCFYFYICTAVYGDDDSDGKWYTHEYKFIAVSTVVPLSTGKHSMCLLVCLFELNIVPFSHSLSRYNSVPLHFMEYSQTLKQHFITTHIKIC